MSEVRMITPEELRMAFRQAIKNLERYAKSVGVDLEPEPQLTQGYTAEQWQEIIDGGYLCEFSGSGNKSIGTLEYIKDNVYDDHPFQQEDDSDWSECRPAQIKGVMRPIFVEPVDEEVMCAFFHQEDRHSYSGKWREMESVRSSSTKYIEL